MTQVLMSDMCVMPSSLPIPTPFETFGFQQGDPIAISGAQSESSVSKGAMQALWLGKGGFGQ